MIKINDSNLTNKLFNKYDISKYFLKDVKENLSLVKFNKGESICYAGDALKYIHFLVEGKAKVTSPQENGKSLVVCLLHDFDIMGQLEYFAETEYTANVEALTDVYCFALDISLLKTKFLDDTIFLRHISKDLANKLISNVHNLSFNLLYPLDTRLATYILLTANEKKFDENLTCLAELLASSYRHLTRVLAKFCKQGILEKKSSYYEIIEYDRLKDISNRSISYY